MSSDLDWLISVDDHVIEPPNVWVDRLPKKYQGIGPRVEKRNGLDTWVYEDKEVPMTGIGAIVGKDIEDWSPAPVNYTEIHPSCYDPAERVKAMDVAGILTQTNFPSYPRFCGQIFKEADDKELALLCVQAWNDYMIDEWANAHPGRFIPLAMIPMWDAQLAAKEAERAIGRGARGIIFSENPASLGLPSIHDAGNYWDPMLKVADDSGLPICMHIGSSSKIEVTAPDAPSIIAIGLGPMLAVKAFWDWMFSGHFFRYPNLKIVLSEGEIGWLPFVLHWMDHTADRQRWAWKGDFNFDMKSGDYGSRELTRKLVDPDQPPSTLFKDHVYGCFIDDPVGVRNMDLIGVDNVFVETDFPHSDGSWPHSIELAKKQLEPLGEEAMRKILTGNASRVFQFTPAAPPS